MISKEVVRYTYNKEIEIEINIHKASTNRKNKAILYFHGGGLVSGVRDDLPSLYLEKFLNAGYDFISMDYPLAPESKIDVILDSCYNTVLYVLNEIENNYEVKDFNYILFGRSAGSYISFMVCDKLIKNCKKTPEALIQLYGYTRLDEDEFNIPNEYYNTMTKISDEVIKSIVSNKPITYGPIMERFLVYLNARQKGNWIKCICGNENPLMYSLNDDDLKCFPPTILAASVRDTDVPYRISSDLHKKLKDSQLITINSDIHDFDRDITIDYGPNTYDDIISWLELKLK